MNRHQTYAIIGKSGCGKSTLLRSINGLTIPDSGTISVFDTPIDYSTLPQLREKIGYAVQGIGLFPHLSIKDNISLLAQLRGWSASKIDERLSEVCELTHLDQAFLKRMPSELSGGQQQRAGLARAFMMDPELILLDEPFGALDPLTRIGVHQQFKEIKQHLQKTIVLVTHDMDEAVSLADEILIMDNGQIKHQLSIEQMIASLKGKSPNHYLLEMLK